jgi:hypothetical protein
MADGPALGPQPGVSLEADHVAGDAFDRNFDRLVRAGWAKTSRATSPAVRSHIGAGVWAGSSSDTLPTLIDDPLT